MSQRNFQTYRTGGNKADYQKIWYSQVPGKSDQLSKSDDVIAKEIWNQSTERKDLSSQSFKISFWEYENQLF
jgi:hypothetical protein